MGEQSLPKIPAAPIETLATSTQYNKIPDALQGHQIMRDSNGNAEDGVNDIGRPNSGRPRKIYVKEGINVDGQAIDVAGLRKDNYGIWSGKAKSSGHPAFLEANADRVKILATATHLNVSIAGIEYELENDINDDTSYTAPPSSNNQCLVNDVGFTGQFWTQTYGELNNRSASSGLLTVDGMGGEISDRIGQFHPLKNETTGEIYYCKIESATTVRLVERICGETDRSAILDDDVLTLMYGYWVFLHNNLLDISVMTRTATNNIPIWSDVAPTPIGAGDMCFNLTEHRWEKWSGSQWEESGMILVGRGYINSAGVLAYVDHVDFGLDWKDEQAAGMIRIENVNTLWLHAPWSVSVGESKPFGRNDVLIEMPGDLASGESELVATWYFVYVDKNGKFRLSSVIPKRYDLRKGWYHPQEYWRAIDLVYNDGSSHFNKDMSIYMSMNGFNITKEMLMQNVSRGLEIPIGGMIWWHKNGVGVPQILPYGWVTCGGQVLSDPESLMDGQTIPNINGANKFIRGSVTSGDIQSNQNKTHTHTGGAHTHDINFYTGNPNQTHTHSFKSYPAPGSPDLNDVTAEQDDAVSTNYNTQTTTTESQAHVHLVDGTSDSGGVVSTGTGTADGTEARPDNISMIAIMRVK